MFDQNKRVNDPKIAEEMARIEKPYRESNGFLKSSQEQINTGIEQGEEFQKKVDPGSLEFDIKVYESFLRDYYRELNYDENSLAGKLERELMEEDITTSLREAQNQHSIIVEMKDKTVTEQQEQQRLENLKNYESLRQTGLCLFDQNQKLEYRRYQDAYYYKDGKTYLVIKDTVKTGENSKSHSIHGNTFYWISNIYGGETVNVEIKEMKIDVWVQELIKIGVDKKVIMEKVASYDQLHN